MQRNTIALIPAYKPTALLTELACKLQQQGCAVVIVNDGSGEEYMPVFRDCSAHAAVLHHRQNAGKGAALKTGLSYIAAQLPKDAVIVTVDADGQHQVEDALALCRVARENPNTLVLGSRKLQKNVPLRSRIGNTATRFVFWLSTQTAVYDTQTGLRAFTASLIPSLLAIPGDRYEYEMHVLLRFAKDRIPIKEHPIQTIYLDNNASSHFDVLRDSLRIYKEILKFSAASIISFLIDYCAYSLLLLTGFGLTASNILARIFSACVNFSLNRLFVFKSKAGILGAAFRYALLAAVILIGNTWVLKLLSETLGIDRFLAKLATEAMFFLFSWLMQRLIVFQKSGGDRA